VSALKASRRRSPECRGLGCEHDRVAFVRLLPLTNSACTPNLPCKQPHGGTSRGGALVVVLCPGAELFRYYVPSLHGTHKALNSVTCRLDVRSPVRVNTLPKLDPASWIIPSRARLGGRIGLGAATGAHNPCTEPTKPSRRWYINVVALRFATPDDLAKRFCQYQSHERRFGADLGL
jgi:hypothetical protein